MHETDALYCPVPLFDATGFLRDPQQWSESLAELIARHDAVELTPAHWRLIRALREFEVEVLHDGT